MRIGYTGEAIILFERAEDVMIVLLNNNRLLLPVKELSESLWDLNFLACKPFNSVNELGRVRCLKEESVLSSREVVSKSREAYGAVGIADITVALTNLGNGFADELV